MKPEALAVAVASGRVGFVYLCEMKVKGWGLSVVGARSSEACCRQVSAWLECYAPSVVMVESLAGRTRKWGRSVENIRALHDFLEGAPVLWLGVERKRAYPNKYLEIEALAAKYPEMARMKVPPRKLWASEARETVLWEALSLFDEACEVE